MLENRNREIVQKLYENFGRGDIPAVLEACAADVDWYFYGPAVIPFAGHHVGHAEVMHFFKHVAETSTIEQFEPRVFIAAENRVVVLGFERVTARATGRSFQQEWLHDFTLRDGKIALIREYYDTAKMAAAYGGA